MRGLANQRDIDIELAQFRDVITAGREVLHVDVPERIKHPPPVPVAVARNGRYLHEQPFATLSRSTEPDPHLRHSQFKLAHQFQPQSWRSDQSLLNWLASL